MYLVEIWFSNLKYENTLENSAASNPNKNTHFQSLYSFVVFNCYILCYLIYYFYSKHELVGLLFLLSTIVVLTSIIIHFPIHTLSEEGSINLRALKWIISILGISIFLHLLLNYTQLGTSFFVCTSVGFEILRKVPFIFPNTFTYNEIILVTSICSNAIFTFCIHLSNTLPIQSEEAIVVEAAIAWLVLTIFLSSKFQYFRSSLFGFINLMMLLLIIQFTPFCLLILKKNPYIWLLDYIFNHSSQRVFIFIYWLALFGCVTIVFGLKKLVCDKIAILEQKRSTQNSESTSNNIPKNDSRSEANHMILLENKHIVLTSMRKFFHFFICLVFLLGVFYDRNLLFLCSYGMLICLALAETIRYHKIGKLGEHFQYMASMFIDEKDKNSDLVLSHFYLLLGLSFPLWISDFEEFNLCHLSGLITVGVGDSFASLIGSRFGKHKIPGCLKKSFEGSFGLIFSEFLALMILAEGGFFNPLNPTNILLICGLLFLTAFIEAYTNDNDNLILPIIAYPLLTLLEN